MLIRSRAQKAGAESRYRKPFLQLHGLFGSGQKVSKSHNVLHTLGALKSSAKQHAQLSFISPLVKQRLLLSNTAGRAALTGPSMRWKDVHLCLL